MDLARVEKGGKGFNDADMWDVIITISIGQSVVLTAFSEGDATEIAATINDLAIAVSLE